MADRSNLRDQLRAQAQSHRQERQAARDIILAPPAALASAALSPREALRSQALGLVGAEGAPEASGGFLDSLPAPVSGALRGLARTLEPLQLPQDAMFAVLAGAIDPNTTIAERLGRMNLKHYLPGGEAPERPASGEEIFRLMGFNEGVSKWAGLTADLVADPLLLGVTLRGIGKLGKIDELVQLGDKLDYFVSPLGMAREANKALRRSQTFSDFQDARMQRVLEAFRNPDSTMFGIQRFGERAANVARKVMPRDRVLQLQFGREDGRAVFQAITRAESTGRRVAEDAVVQLQRSMFGVNGDQNRSRFALVLKSMEDQARSWEARLSELRPVIREVVDAEAHRFAVNQVSEMGGPGIAAALQDGLERVITPELRRVGEDIRGALRAYDADDLGGVAGDAIDEMLGAFRVRGTVKEFVEELGQAEHTYRLATAEAHERIAGVARREAERLGLGAEASEKMVRDSLLAFDDYLRDTLMIDARIGFHTSGYEFVANSMRSRVMELGGSADEAQAVWGRVLRAGMLGGQKGVEGVLDTATNLRLMIPKGLNNREAQRHMRLANIHLNAVEAEYSRIAALRAKDAGRASPEYRSAAELLKGQVEEGAARTERVVQRGLRDLDVSEAGVYAYTLPDLPVALSNIAEESKRIVTESLRASTGPKVTAARQGRRAAMGELDRARSAREAAEAAARPPQVAPEQVYRVRLPKGFIDDRISRDMDVGRILKETSRHYDMEFNQAQWDDLISDINYYTDAGVASDMGREFMGLRSSARATRRRMEGVTPTTVTGREAARVAVHRTRVHADEMRYRYEGAASSGRVDPERLARYKREWDEAEEAFQAAERAAKGVVPKEASKAATQARRAERTAQARAERAAAAAKVTPAPSAAAQRAVEAVYETSDKLEGATTVYLQALEALGGNLTPVTVSNVMKAERELERLLSVLEGRLVKAATESGLGVAGGVVQATHPAFRRLPDALNELLENAQSLRAQVRAVLVDPKRQAGEFLAAERAAAKTITREVSSEAEAGVRNINKAVTEANQAAREAQRARLVREDALAQANYGARRAGSRAHLHAVGREATGVAKTVDPGLNWQIPERMPPLASAGNNATAYDILSARMYNAARNSKTAAEATMEAVMDAPITVRELIEGSMGLQALPLGEYLQGLMDGHLRKTYGLFLDSGGFQRYVDRVNDGGIVASRMLDEVEFVNNPRFQGLDNEVALFQEYRATLAQAGNDKVLRRGGIQRFLESAGANPHNINRFLREMHASVSETPAWQRAVRVLDEQRLIYERQLQELRSRPRGMGDVPRVTNQRVFEERAELTAAVAEALGENAMASIAILESAEYGRRVITRQAAFQNVLEASTKRGLIKSEPFTDTFGAVYVRLGDSVEGMGGFAGKYIHPHLVKELQRLSQVEPPMINPALARIRSLITGGYLAAPAVLSANVVGGFYQAATAGLGPVVMAKRMAEVLPDMRKAAKGEHTDLMAEVYSKLDVRLTTLVNNEALDAFSRTILKNVEMGPEGAAKLFDEVTSAMENFLQAPGLGRFKARWAGLEGFQFTEEWFKVAAYKEMRDRLLREGAPGLTPGQRITLSYEQAVDHAAEFARTVVFDYSTLPDSLEFAKKYGLVLFPGFPYYLAGRTLSTAAQRPGVLAVSDRISEAMMNASLDPAEQVMAYLGMPDWLKDDQGAPLLFGNREDANGNKMTALIPMAQLIPTATVWDSMFGGGLGSNPWAQSIKNVGLWGPLIDIVSALGTGTGEAPLSGPYGHRVFDPDSEGLRRAADVARFLYNTMAPSIVRKGIRQDYQGDWVGAIPAIPRALFGEPDRSQDYLAGLYSIEERRVGRPDSTWREDVMSALVRTPQVVALEGPLAGIRKEMDRARNALNERLNSVMARYRRARADGNDAAAARHLEEANEMRRAFNAEWAAYTQYFRAWQAQRQQQGGQ